jgi:transposase-like protein
VRGRKTNWSVDFKLRALSRMAETYDVSALAAELCVGRERLYEWRRCYEAGGVEALRSMGRPRRSQRLAAAVAQRPVPAGPEQRIADLERTIGQQLLDLDFFRAALRHVRDQQPAKGEPGDTTSTR